MLNSHYGGVTLVGYSGAVREIKHEVTRDCVMLGTAWCRTPHQMGFLQAFRPRALDLPWIGPSLRPGASTDANPGNGDAAAAYATWERSVTLSGRIGARVRSHQVFRSNTSNVEVADA